MVTLIISILLEIRFAESERTKIEEYVFHSTRLQLYEVF